MNMQNCAAYFFLRSLLGCLVVESWEMVFDAVLTRISKRKELAYSG